MFDHCPLVFPKHLTIAHHHNHSQQQLHLIVYTFDIVPVFVYLLTHGTPVQYNIEQLESIHWQ